MILRYLVFAGLNNYPKGGWGDYKFSTNNLEEAEKERDQLLNNGNQWSEIIDLEILEMVQI